MRSLFLSWNSVLKTGIAVHSSMGQSRNFSVVVITKPIFSIMARMCDDCDIRNWNRSKGSNALYVCNFGPLVGLPDRTVNIPGVRLR